MLDRPAGITIVIVREDLLVDQPKTVAEHSAGNSGMLMTVPSMLDYKIMADTDSLYNTPPVFAVYVCMLTLRWLRSQGGVAAIEKLNNEKAALLYKEIDENELFVGTVNKEDRSKMNVCFVMKDPSQETAFLKYTQSLGIVGIKGHRSVGGFRASLYNALPISSVQVLVNAMKEFKNSEF